MTLSSKFFPLYMRVMPAVSVTVSSSAGKFGFAAIALRRADRFDPDDLTVFFKQQQTVARRRREWRSSFRIFLTDFVTPQPCGSENIARAPASVLSEHS